MMLYCFFSLPLDILKPMGYSLKISSIPIRMSLFLYSVALRTLAKRMVHQGCIVTSYQALTILGRRDNAGDEAVRLNHQRKTPLMFV